MGSKRLRVFHILPRGRKGAVWKAKSSFLSSWDGVPSNTSEKEVSGPKQEPNPTILNFWTTGSTTWLSHKGLQQMRRTGRLSFQLRWFCLFLQLPTPLLSKHSINSFPIRMSNSDGAFDGYISKHYWCLREESRKRWGWVKHLKLGQSTNKAIDKVSPLGACPEWLSEDERGLGCTSPTWKTQVGPWEMCAKQMYTEREKRLGSPKLGNSLLQCARNQLLF